MPWLKYLALKEAKTLSTREVSLRDEAGQVGERRAGKVSETVHASDGNKERQSGKKKKVEKKTCKFKGKKPVRKRSRRKMKWAGGRDSTRGRRNRGRKSVKK